MACPICGARTRDVCQRCRTEQRLTREYQESEQYTWNSRDEKWEEDDS